MKRRVSPPPVAEWDFSSVEYEDLPVATMYEYARSSSLHDRICKWLDIDKDGHSIREHLIAALTVPRPSWWNDDPDYFGDIEPGWLFDTGNYRLYNLIHDRCPDFPAPWCQSIGSKAQREARWTWPALKVGPLWDMAVSSALQLSKYQSTEQLKSFLESRKGAYCLVIDWERSLESILIDFEHWLRAEAKTHAGRKRGKPSQNGNLEPLKWLSAYRLSKAGFTFTQAQAVLDCYISPTAVCRNLARDAGILDIPDWKKPSATALGAKALPQYASPEVYSKAVAKAGKKLKDVESGPFDL